MEQYGFRCVGDRYVYETDFMDGEFSARVSVTKNGEVTGTVIDRMNSEEYLQLRIERFDGAYVNAVRNAYEAVLNRIADACCTEVLFASDQANRITEQIRIRYSVAPDFPWGTDPYDTAGVFRHTDTQKWFALLMSIKTSALLKNGDSTPIDVLNLKIDPNDAEALHQRAGVYPAYHMNHRHWITAVLNDTLEDTEVMELIDQSYKLTQTKTRTRKETV